MAVKQPLFTWSKWNMYGRFTGYPSNYFSGCDHFIYSWGVLYWVSVGYNLIHQTAKWQIAPLCALSDAQVVLTR